MSNPIKELRKHLNLTQAEFAAKIGSKQTTVAGWESGNHAPTGSSMILIANTFDVNLEYLRTGRGPMMRNEDPSVIYGEKIGRILALPEDDLRRQIIQELIDMPEDRLSLFLEFAKFIRDKDK